jgi:hypothetical protein
MKSISKKLLAGVVLSAATLLSQGTWASPDDGASCRAEFTPILQTGGVFLCAVQNILTAEFDCPTGFRLNHRAGEDKCVALNGGREVTPTIDQTKAREIARRFAITERQRLGVPIDVRFELTRTGIDGNGINDAAEIKVTKFASPVLR